MHKKMSDGEVQYFPKDDVHYIDARALGEMSALPRSGLDPCSTRGKSIPRSCGDQSFIACLTRVLPLTIASTQFRSLLVETLVVKKLRCWYIRWSSRSHITQPCRPHYPSRRAPQRIPRGSPRPRECLAQVCVLDTLNCGSKC